MLTSLKHAGIYVNQFSHDSLLAWKSIESVKLYSRPSHVWDPTAIVIWLLLTPSIKTIVMDSSTCTQKDKASFARMLDAMFPPTLGDLKFDGRAAHVHKACWTSFTDDKLKEQHAANYSTIAITRTSFLTRL